MTRPDLEPLNFIHAGALTAVTADRCSWRWSFEDVHLRCDDTVLPGEGECAEHFIAAAHRRDVLERARRRQQAPFSPQWRRFPASPVTPKENEE